MAKQAAPENGARSPSRGHLDVAQNPRKESVINIKGFGSKRQIDDKLTTTIYDNDENNPGMQIPHSLFIEMDELIGEEFIEQSRWIKYEECREEGSEKWGKPHVSNLSFHSLLNVRIHLERGEIHISYYF